MNISKISNIPYKGVYVIKGSVDDMKNVRRLIAKNRTSETPSCQNCENERAYYWVNGIRTMYQSTAHLMIANGHDNVCMLEEHRKNCKEHEGEIFSIVDLKYKSPRSIESMEEDYLNGNTIQMSIFDAWHNQRAAVEMAMMSKKIDSHIETLDAKEVIGAINNNSFDYYTGEILDMGEDT